MVAFTTMEKEQARRSEDFTKEKDVILCVARKPTQG